MASIEPETENRTDYAAAEIGRDDIHPNPGQCDEAKPIGKQLYAAHGSRDRITSARGTEAYVRRAREVARTAEFTDMGRVGHYLLRGRRSWNAFALESALRVLGQG